MKDKKKEIVEIEIPSKAIRVKHASCPNGHSLMNDEHTINGYPTVTVRAKYKDEEGLMHLDPIYGSYRNLPEIKVPEGECVEFFCPECNISLSDHKQDCDECGADMFAINLPHGGLIEGCLRNGCQFHNMKFTDSEELGHRLLDENTLDSFL